MKKNKYIFLTVVSVLLMFLVSAAFASSQARGLYQDGAYYLLRIAEKNWFYLVDPARMTTQIIRQLPVVLLSLFSDASLFQRAQVFTFVMLATPPAMIAVCYFLAPRGERGWALIPILYLLLGFSPTSFEAVGEASIGTSYLWVLIFLLMFGCQTIISQIIFLFLTLPAFHLHEAIVLCMPFMILICILRFTKSTQFFEKIFLLLAIIIFMACSFYQLSWIMYPRLPGSTAGAWQAISRLEFIQFEGRWNLPVISGLLAIVALTSVYFMLKFITLETENKSVYSVALIFSIICALVVFIANYSDIAFAPRAQAQARYNPIFATMILLGFLLFERNERKSYAILTSVPVLVIIIGLGINLFLIDLIYTQKWTEYIEDFDRRLGNFTGLIHWEEGSQSFSQIADENWKMMTIDWTLPIMSIILARNGQVAAIFDYPPWATFRPIDPKKLEQLPPLRGVNYDRYRNAFTLSKN